MRKRQVLKIVSFCIVVILLVVFLSDFLAVNSKHDQLRLYGFYLEPEDSLDVVLIGASELYRGYYAPLAYQESGFTSYAMATAAMPASLYLPALKEVRKYQSPSLYVFEVNGVFYEDQHKEASLRKWIDNIPMSENKVETIEQLVPKEQQDSYYAELKKYHDNWKELPLCFEIFKEKMAMQNVGYSYTKNYVTYATITPAPTDVKKEKRQITASGEAYLRELLQYCKDENLENVLFVRWPHRNKFETPESYEKLRAILSEYGYDFVNFSEQIEEIGLDMNQDFNDNEHLNIFGTEKMTKYFARYVTEQYDVVSSHSSDVTKEWESCVTFMNNVIEPCKEETLRNTKKNYYKDSDYT